MQRVECSINDMKQTMETICTSLKSIDDKVNKLVIKNNINPRSTKTAMSNTGVKFSSVDQEIP